MIAQALILMGITLVLIVVAAYLLGEWRGSRTMYEPIPTDSTPTVDYSPEDIAHLEVPVVVDYVAPVTREEVTEVLETLKRTESLLTRYRREALVATKRLEVVIRMLLSPRRPSHKTLANTTVEVKGRELPAVPPAMLEG